MTFIGRWRGIFGAIWPVRLMRGRVCEPKHDGWHMGTLVDTKIADEALGASGRVGSSSSAGQRCRGIGANNAAVLCLR